MYGSAFFRYIRSIITNLPVQKYADNSCQSHVARPSRPAGIQRPFGHIILMHAFYFVINLRGAPVSNRQRFIFETRLRAALITGTERSARSGIGICLHSRRVARVAARRPSHRWAWAKTFAVEKFGRKNCSRSRVGSFWRERLASGRGRRVETSASTGRRRPASLKKLLTLIHRGAMCNLFINLSWSAATWHACSAGGASRALPALT